MGAEGRLEGEIVIKSPAHKFFKRLSEELHHLPDATPDRIHAVQVHEGDFKTHGSIKSWTYTVDGKQEVFKENFEIDEESMTVRMVAAGGDILERLKSYKVIYKVISKGDVDAARLIITLLYEKQDSEDEIAYHRVGGLLDCYVQGCRQTPYPAESVKKAIKMDQSLIAPFLIYHL